MGEQLHQEGPLEYEESSLSQKNLEANDETEHKDIDHRHTLFSQILREYSNHRSVATKLNSFRVHPKPLTFIKNEIRRYQSLVEQYPYIDDDEVMGGFFN